MIDPTHDSSNDYLQRLDAMIQSSERLHQLLLAARSEGLGAAKGAELTTLLDALEKRVPAAQWLRDPVLASLLPIVIRFHCSQGETASDRKAAFGLLRVPELRRSNWVRPLLYPATLGILAAAIMLFLAIAVVPVFRKMFEEFGMVLPAPTLLIIHMSDAITGRSPWTLVQFLSLFVGAWIAGRGVLWAMDRMHQYALFGSLFTGSHSHLIAMARWTATIAELLQIGVPKPLAIEVAGVASRKTFYRVQAKRIARWLEESARPLVGSPVAQGFSPTALQALDVANEGASIATLRCLSRIYLERLEHRTRSNPEAIGPIAIILLGFLVGFVVIAMFMPLLSLITSLSS